MDVGRWRTAGIVLARCVFHVVQTLFGDFFGDGLVIEDWLGDGVFEEGI
jgi:hypothetical protein